MSKILNPVIAHSFSGSSEYCNVFAFSKISSIDNSSPLTVSDFGRCENIKRGCCWDIAAFMISSAA